MLHARVLRQPRPGAVLADVNEAAIARHGARLVRTGEFAAIQAVTDTKFHTLTGNVTGLANTLLGSAITVPAGLTIFGLFTAIDLHSGSIIAYKK